jgi:hypothetical protein
MPKTSNGTVTMTLETYNEMLLKIAKYEGAITVKERWRGDTSIEVRIKVDAFKEVIDERLEEFSEAHDNVEITYNEYFDGTVATTDIADMKKEEEPTE